MTDQELLGAARQTLNMARTDFELQGWPTSIAIASYHVKDNPPLHRMRKIERLLQDQLGEEWLNDGARKDYGFRVLRLSTLALPPDAMVIATPTNMFRPTAKFMAKFKGKGEAAKRATDTPEQRRRLVAEGLLEMVDSVTATAQNPERVCVVMQPVNRGVNVGEPQVNFFDQDSFEGRMKMYGGEIDEAEREEVAMFLKAFQKARAARMEGEMKQ